MTVTTAFTPSDRAPFRFTASIGGQTFFVSVPYNRYANRYYVQLNDTSNTIVIYTPLVASPDDHDINLALPYAPGTFIYRANTKNFEAT